MIALGNDGMKPQSSKARVLHDCVDICVILSNILGYYWDILGMIIRMPSPGFFMESQLLGVGHPKKLLYQVDLPSHIRMECPHFILLGCHQVIQRTSTLWASGGSQSPGRWEGQQV